MNAAGSLSLQEATALAARLRDHVTQQVFGQDTLITETLCCLLAGGHILMTGAPGLAKTTLVRVFARQLGVAFGRVQFTPDLLPSDILGSEVLNVEPQSGKRLFEFSRGPVFTNLLLADEINRASPRTQSALLEAMQERSVTVGGRTHTLALPFMVFATQNPFESEGTFPLPEAQLDRFLVHTLVPYPDEKAESQILSEHAAGKLVGEQAGVPRAAEQPALVEGQIQALIERAKQIRVDEPIINGIRDLVRSTRPTDPSCPETVRPAIWYGAGPRAGISLVSVARALALVQQEESVRWEHVRRMALPVLRHRVRLTAQGMREGMDEDAVVGELLGRLEARLGNLARGVG
jgi:MoxR-like ATPase